ncbi:hypothetical protein B0O80DRAFT_493242 [Mortierella sp. GBAus27b]|nr:hypothetical protein B0O80DRAFT_493242 [Mortierella sp. GBAus27b]
MFNILELDEMVCHQLGRHDLAHCVRVNKLWHAIISPFLWRDLTCIVDWPRASPFRSSFRGMVIEDYLWKQRHQELPEAGHGMEQPIQREPPTFLSKYSPFVQHLPDPGILLGVLDAKRGTHYLLAPQPSEKDQDSEPTPHELLYHLYMHCPSLQVSTFNWNLTWNNLPEAVVDFLISRTISLQIWNLQGIRPDEIIGLLNQCSQTLKKLALDITRFLNDEYDDVVQDAAEPWMNLDTLKLSGCQNVAMAKEFWTWLWKRCGRVRRLELMINGSISPTLSKEMHMYMPHLHRFHIGGTSLRDEEIAEILSGCRHGWTEVVISFFVEFKDAAKKALIQHCPTLEKLVNRSDHGFSKEELVCILASSPNLRKFHCDKTTDSDNSVEALMDEDPSTGLLKPWACELSLREFKVKLLGIPEFDTSPDLNRLVQRRVYERLARFTNLEKLWLAERMDLSEEFGFHRLSTLRSLKKLWIYFPRTGLSTVDVQWMVVNWPKLCGIGGTMEYITEGRDVTKWLREHPQITILHSR